MRLVEKETGREIKVGDVVTSFRGEKYTVKYFREPHKASSCGKISVRRDNGEEYDSEFYVTAFGLEWIEREDRNND